MIKLGPRPYRGFIYMVSQPIPPPHPSPPPPYTPPALPHKLSRGEDCPMQTDITI